MIETIRRAADGKLKCFFESTEGFPAFGMVRTKLGVDNIRAAPAELFDGDSIGGDAMLVFRVTSSIGKQSVKQLEMRIPALPAGGYRIECVKRRGSRILVVAGGDLFGMLAGLADAILHGEITRDGFIYRGGVRTEIPALPCRYYWTRDDSTNWVLDDEGNQFAGCNQTYTKKPETFIEDYRRLVDHCVEMRFNGLIIWGFLRDGHGGEAAAYQVARYAADHGVTLMPGVGTTGYGGVYYEGNHPCNIETYLARHPERGNMGADGQCSGGLISPYNPKNLEWIARCVEWLYRSFPIGGCNMENYDLLVDYSPAGKRGRARIKTREKDYFKDQFFAYKTALDATHRLAPHGWNAYATYTGFGPIVDKTSGYDGVDVEPYFAKRMPESSIAQWTISGMVSETVIPLREWMKSPRPAAVYKNPRWPKGLRPPTPRSAGFMHQASQWFMPMRRTDVAISSLAEGCLRCFEEGFEGISVHGEVSSRLLAWKLNYLAMRHWTYHPESTLEEFALEELAPRVGGEQAARTYIEVLCRLEEGKTGLELEKMFGGCSAPFCPRLRTTPVPGQLEKYNMWVPLKEWNCCRDAPTRYPYRSISLGGGVA